MDADTCRGTSKDGEPCTKHRQRDGDGSFISDYCWQHDPEREKRSPRRSRTFGLARRLPSGRWQAGYRHNGERYWETFGTKADADAWLARSQTDIGRGEWTNPDAGRLTVEELAARWLTSNERKRSSTRQRDEAILRVHVCPTLGRRRLSMVRQPDIQALVDHWAAKLSPSTVGRQYTCMAAMFSFAVDSDLLVKTPCRRIRLPQVRPVERPELGPEQLERLADELGENHAVMMWLAAAQGYRFAECAGLTVGDLNLLAATITIGHQLDRRGNLVEVKSASSEATTACPEWLANDLSALLARRGLTAADSEALVFVSPSGAALRYTNWRRRVWAPACERAELPGLVFHDLRSLSATALVALKTDVKTAQRRLRHSSAKVTLDIYARATSKADREAAEGIGEYLRPNKPTRVS